MVHVGLSSGTATRRDVYERRPVYQTAGLGSRFYFHWYGCLDVPIHQDCALLVPCTNSVFVWGCVSSTPYRVLVWGASTWQALSVARRASSLSLTSSSSMSCVVALVVFFVVISAIDNPSTKPSTKTDLHEHEQPLTGHPPAFLQPQN